MGASGRSWALLGRSWEGLRWVLGGFGMGLGRVPGGFALLFAAGQLEFKFESSSISSRLLWFAWACVCTTKCGTHFELEL